MGDEVGHWTLHADGVRSGTLSLFDGERIGAATDRDIRPSARRRWLADRFVVNVTPMAIRLGELG